MAYAISSDLVAIHSATLTPGVRIAFFEKSLEVMIMHEVVEHGEQVGLAYAQARRALGHHEEEGRFVDEHRMRRVLVLQGKKVVVVHDTEILIHEQLLEGWNAPRVEGHGQLHALDLELIVGQSPAVKALLEGHGRE